MVEGADVAEFSSLSIIAGIVNMRLFRPKYDSEDPREISRFIEYLIGVWTGNPGGSKEVQRIIRSEAGSADGRKLLARCRSELEKRLKDTRDREIWLIYQQLLKLTARYRHST